MNISREQLWFKPFSEMVPIALGLSDGVLRGEHKDVPHIVHATMALDFFRHAIFAIEEANKRGHHAIAVSLLRQCVDPLFLIECGLVANQTAKSALEAWSHKGTTIGKLRSQFGHALWSLDSSSFLGHPWATFMADLYKNIQEYAHYNPTTLQWAMNALESKWHEDGYIGVAAETWRYCPEKATRITQYQSIMIYAVARTFMTASRANGWQTIGLSELMEAYQRGMQESNLIGRPFDWKSELLGMWIDRPPTH